EKLVAVKNLRDIMPRYLDDLTDEEILTGKATKAIQNHTDALILQSKIKSKQRAIDAILDNKGSGEIDLLTQIRYEIEELFAGTEYASKNLARTFLNNVKSDKAAISGLYKSMLADQTKLNELLGVQPGQNNNADGRNTGKVTP